MPIKKSFFEPNCSSTELVVAKLSAVYVTSESIMTESNSNTLKEKLPVTVLS